MAHSKRLHLRNELSLTCHWIEWNQQGMVKHTVIRNTRKLLPRGHSEGPVLPGPSDCYTWLEGTLEINPQRIAARVKYGEAGMEWDDKYPTSWSSSSPIFL